MCTASWPRSVTRSSGVKAEAVAVGGDGRKARYPEKPAPLLKSNRMGGGDLAPPRVHTWASFPSPSHPPSLDPSLHVDRVFLTQSEVTSRPRTGHAARPNPCPHCVLKEGMDSHASLADISNAAFSWARTSRKYALPTPSVCLLDFKIRINFCGKWRGLQRPSTTHEWGPCVSWPPCPG